MTILITIALTISVLLLILMYSVNLANYMQTQKVMNVMTEMITHMRSHSNQINNLQKYLTELNIAIENLTDTTVEFGQAVFENSFKIVRDGPRAFTGFTPDEIVEKMRKENYELSDEEIDQLRDLFMGLDEEDGEETL